MQIVAKHQLESICVGALNGIIRERNISAVTLARAPVGTANWTLRAVVPRFHLQDVRRSHAVIRELQTIYRMAGASPSL